jgi:division protein CdvB (Snf7/Vps24/ESCRT-III family)
LNYQFFCAGDFRKSVEEIYNALEGLNGTTINTLKMIENKANDQNNEVAVLIQKHSDLLNVNVGKLNVMEERMSNTESRLTSALDRLQSLDSSLERTSRSLKTVSDQVRTKSF